MHNLRIFDIKFFGNEVLNAIYMYMRYLDIPGILILRYEEDVQADL